MIATSGGNRSGPPGRLTHAGSAFVASPQRVFIADRTCEIGVAGCEIGAFGEHPSGNAGIGAIDAPSVDVAGIDEPEPMQHAGGMIVPRRRSDFDIASKVRPGGKTVAARDTGLRVVQTKSERRDLLVAPARGRRQCFTKPRDRFGIAVSVETDQVFGLLLQIGRDLPARAICSIGDLRASNRRTTRKTGCTKAQTLFDRCKWVQPFPRVRVRLAPQTRNYHRRSRKSIRATDAGTVAIRQLNRRVPRDKRTIVSSYRSRTA